MDDKECYEFIIRDRFGDGVCCDYGNGYYKLTDANGFIVAQGDSLFLEDRVLLTTGWPTNMEQEKQHRRPTIFPTLVDKVITLDNQDFSGMSSQVRILNIWGNEVFSHTYEASTQDINVSSLTEGIYFMEVLIAGESYVLKFVKQ
jgi:hypothetical protein